MERRCAMIRWKVDGRTTRDEAAVTPHGYISVKNLADLSGMAPLAVSKACRKAGIDEVTVCRVNVGGLRLGGRLLCFAKDEALALVLGKEEA
jgi:hypothetical protein